MRFLPKHNIADFVFGCVIVVYLSRLLVSALCIFNHAKRGLKPNSHAVLPVSKKRNGESLKKNLYHVE